MPLHLTGIKRVVCLGAHSDDIEIGCGGTLLRLLRENDGVQVRWAVFSGGPAREKEARASAKTFLDGAAKADIRIARFRESFFPAQWSAIKEQMERLRKGFEPDLVLTHCRDDRHQDHRVLSDLAWNTFRNHFILEYEIPKYDGDLGQPNLFVPLNRATARAKTDALMKHFVSQRTRHWFTAETFLGLMRLRGVECAAEYAEAFHARKLRIG